MGMTERIREAWQVLRGGKAGAIFGIQQMPAYPGLFEAQGNKAEMLANYTSWVYACISIRAKAVAASRFRLYARHGARRLEELSEHPLLTLFDEMNPFDTRTDIIHRTVVHLDLTGDAYWYVPKNRLGVPAEAWVLPPDRMRILPDPKRVIAGYELTTAEGQIRFRSDEIVHFRYPHPREQFYGASPLMAAAAAVDINAYQYAFQRSFYRNSANPPVVLKTEHKLDEKTYLRLKADWERRNKGSENFGRIAILEAGLSVEHIGLNPKDLDWLATNKATRDTIFAIYGVPASKLGLVEDVNRANAEANDYTFAVNVVEPILTMLDERLTQDLARQFDPLLILRHESTVKEDEERRARVMEIRLRTGMTSINEERAAQGYAPVAGGDEPLVKGTCSRLSAIE